MSHRRSRLYRLYAIARGWHVSTRPGPLHGLEYDVRAYTIRQAYWLAAHGVEAAGAGTVGITRIVHVDRWAGERTTVWREVA